MPCTILGHVDGDEHRAVVFERNRAQDACRQMGERIARLEAALHLINALIDSPARFNADVQAVLDGVIDTSDIKFDKAISGADGG